MAALANIFSRITVSRILDQRPLAAIEGSTVPTGFAPLRPFANEDVLFYVKRIDNSGVIRESDPGDRGSAWKLIGGVGVAAVLAIGILLPGAYDLMAGFEIQNLKKEASDLRAQQAKLDVDEAKLLTPARIEALAREQQFTDPAPEALVFLNSKDTSAVAANRPAVEPAVSGRPDSAKR